MFEMGFLAEREMLFWERNRYIQVCMENEYAALYYDNKEEKIIRYKTGKKIFIFLKISIMYFGYVVFGIFIKC